jgi:ribose 5-phosphate isomerase RpiB
MGQAGVDRMSQWDETADFVIVGAGAGAGASIAASFIFGWIAARHTIHTIAEWRGDPIP